MDQAEQLRLLVTKQQEQKKKERKTSRVITVTSGKGGVGKSTLTVKINPYREFSNTPFPFREKSNNTRCRFRIGKY